MKKLKIAKMGLNREKVRTLAGADLERAQGQFMGQCTGYTIIGSGCSSRAPKCWLVP
jgi:hypothetical protein